MVPACSSGALTNVLPHWNALLQTQDMPFHPVTVCRHGADLSLCDSLMWNTGIHNYPYQCLVSDLTLKFFPDLPHTPSNAQLYDVVMVVVSPNFGIKCTIPTGS